MLSIPVRVTPPFTILKIINLLKSVTLWTRRYPYLSRDAYSLIVSKNKEISVPETSLVSFPDGSCEKVILLILMDVLLTCMAS